MLYRLFVVFVVLASAGCATKSVTSDFSFDKNPQAGLVVFSVTNDKSSGMARGRALFYMNGGSLFNENRQILSSYDEIAPGIRKSGKDFKDVEGRLFVVSLPEGEHALTSWQIATGTLYIRPKDDPIPLTFQVRAGAVKYLGNFHVNFGTGKNILGMTVVGDGYPEIRDERKRDLALFEERYTHLKDEVRIALLKLGPWFKSLETGKDPSMPPPAVYIPQAR